jgi:hypothetical protein
MRTAVYSNTNKDLQNSMPLNPSKQDAPELTPLLGAFTKTKKGEIILNLIEPKLEGPCDVLLVSSEKMVGLVTYVKLISKPDKLSEIPGHLSDYLNNGEIYLYSGTGHFARTKLDSAIIGCVFRQGSHPVDLSDTKKMEVKYNNNLYIVSQFFSEEGIHFECFDKSSKKLKANMYYYLNHN